MVNVTIWCIIHGSTWKVYRQRDRDGHEHGDRDRQGEKERGEGGKRESVIGKDWFIQLQDLARADDQEGKIVSKLEPCRFGVSTFRESLSPVLKV